MSLIIRFSDQAENDLDEIWDYAAEHSFQTADQRVKRILSVCFSFIETPELGRHREEFRKGMRSFAVGNYIIFYRAWSERIDILRIIHGARDLEILLVSGDEETFTKYAG